MRNWLVAVVLVALATIGLNVNPVQAGTHKEKFADLAITNESPGGTFDILIEPTNKAGKIAKRGSQRFSVDIPANGSFTWNKAETNQRYLVTIWRDGMLAVEPTFVDRGGGEVLISGIIPADPKGLEIAALKAEINDLKTQLVAANSNVLALQAQIKALQVPQSEPLIAKANAAFTASNPRYMPGTAQARIASYILSAYEAEDARVSLLRLGRNFTPGLNLQNMVAKVNGNQFGNVRATIGDTEPSLMFSSPSPISVPASTSVRVDIYADILTSSQVGTYSSVIELIGWSATGQTSGNLINFLAEVPGQDVMVSTDTLMISATTIGATQNKVRTVLDESTSISFKAISNGQLNGLSVMFTGDIAGYYNGPFAIGLVDTESNSSAQVNTTWDESRGAWVADFTGMISYIGTAINAGSTRTFRVRLYSADFANPTSGPDSLKISVVEASWSGGTVSLPVTVFDGTYE